MSIIDTQSQIQNRNVFINCPFDSEYHSLFIAIVFTVTACGFVPRCALEQSNAGQTRIDKILDIIAASPLSVHDISRTDLDTANELPRFNMPFELGLFMGAMRFDRPTTPMRSCIVFDIEPYRYQKFLSDISGQDVIAHQGKVSELISKLRDWLAGLRRGERPLQGGAYIFRKYKTFRSELPAICASLHLNVNQLTFIDWNYVINAFLELEEMKA